MSSYTSNDQYRSLKEWYWWVSANTARWIHGRLHNCLLKLPAYFLCWHCQIQTDFGYFWVKKGSKHVQLYIKCPIWIHKRMILMSSFTKYSPLDPWETPQTALWNCQHAFCCNSLCGHCQIQADFGSIWMEEGSKHVQLHIKCPVWIHKWMILMSFNSNGVCWINGRLHKLPYETASMLSVATVCVGTVRSRLILGPFGWKKGPSMSSYTSNVQYGSIKEWYWWVSANSVCWINGRLHKLPYDTASMLSVLTLLDPGWFRVLLGKKGSKHVQLHIKWPV